MKLGRQKEKKKMKRVQSFFFFLFCFQLLFVAESGASVQIKESLVMSFTYDITNKIPLPDTS